MNLLRLIARILFYNTCYNFIDPLGFAHTCDSLSNWKPSGSFALSAVAAHKG
jgi:hypothetical protein